ncbi:Uncharacterized protein QTN25_009619 [Entamoeba marina]
MVMAFSQHLSDIYHKFLSENSIQVDLFDCKQSFMSEKSLLFSFLEFETTPDNCDYKSLRQFIDELFSVISFDHHFLYTKIIELCQSKSQTSIKQLRVLLFTTKFKQQYELHDILSSLFSTNILPINDVYSLYQIKETDNGYESNFQKFLINFDSTKFLPQDLGLLLFDLHKEGGLVTFLRKVINHKKNPSLFHIPPPFVLSTLNTTLLFNSLIFALAQFPSNDCTSFEFLPDDPYLYIPPKSIQPSLTPFGTTNFVSTQKQTSTLSSEKNECNVSPFFSVSSEHNLSNAKKESTDSLKDTLDYGDVSNHCYQTDIIFDEDYIYEDGSYASFTSHIFLYYTECISSDLQLFRNRYKSMFSKQSHLSIELFSIFLYDFTLHLLPYQFENLITLLKLIVGSIESFPNQTIGLNNFKSILFLIQFIIDNITLFHYNDDQKGVIDAFCMDLLEKFISEFYILSDEKKEYLFMTMVNYLPYLQHQKEQQLLECINISLLFPLPIQEYLFNSLCSESSKRRSSSFQLLRCAYDMSYYRINCDEKQFIFIKTVSSGFKQELEKKALILCEKMLYQAQKSLKNCIELSNISSAFISNITESIKIVDFVFWIINNKQLNSENITALDATLVLQISLLQLIYTCPSIVEPFKTKFTSILTLVSLQLFHTLQTSVSEYHLQQEQIHIFRLFVETIEWEEIINNKYLLFNIDCYIPPYIAWKQPKHFINTAFSEDLLYQLQEAYCCVI